jgi:transcription-repair coupling factor (superfamily II helicase)
MAMSGIRDMSLLDEAPGDRYPVQTYVLEHNDGVITEAIRRELGRGGQVLYLYNRTASIDTVAAKIAARCPEASVVYAHGKMEKEELEDIWQGMVNGEIDVLVCTTIVETGVDLPNANTLVIEDADRMGLSQLHQIRGRVGRSGRHAYAYFTYRAGKSLSEIATKRLQAIREYAGFGAGFRIALRDLELRGAGNLLGAEQHGHIESVGYDMYVRLLNEAVLAERGELPPPVPEAQVSFAGDALIPERYIESSAHRMEMYKKISLIGTKEDLSDVLDEFCDRFGEPPKGVEGLVKVALLRNTASGLGIYEIGQQNNSLLLYVDEVDMGMVAILVKGMRGRILVSKAPRPYITVKKSVGQSPLDTLEEAFNLLTNAKKESEEK